MTRLIVLLRGVNVSGHNKVPMADLRAALTSAGFANVATYIQSGNIAIDIDEATDPSDVTDTVAMLLADRFDVDVPVVSVPQADVVDIQTAAPFAPNANPAYQLIYLPGGRINIAGIDSIDPDRFPGDLITATERAVYVSYANGQGKSKLSVNQLERAAGTTLTGRNINSIEKLKTL